MKEKLDVMWSKKTPPVRIRGAVYNQFAAGGKWLKGNLHCHLDGWSSEAPDIYRSFGYDLIAAMDHDRAVFPKPRKDMIFLAAAEMTPGHLLVFGLDDVSRLADSSADRCMATAAMISRTRDAGGAAFLGHPLWCGWTPEELRFFTEAGVHGLEVMNPANWLSGDSGYSDQLWHVLVGGGTSLAGIAGDDAHGPEDVSEKFGKDRKPYLSWTGVLAGDFSASGVLAALKEGRTYASEGPVFHSVNLSSCGKLIVKCSPCIACHFRGKQHGYGGRSSFPPEDSATAEEFCFDFAESGYRVKDYLFVILEDNLGRKAYLSPIRIEMEFQKAGSRTGAKVN